MNAKTETPQESMDTAITKVSVAHSGNSITNAELAIKLAEAQARLYSAQQQEAKNLLALLNGEYRFNADVVTKAKERLLTLLNIA